MGKTKVPNTVNFQIWQALKHFAQEWTVNRSITLR